MTRYDLREYYYKGRNEVEYLTKKVSKEYLCWVEELAIKQLQNTPDNSGYVKCAYEIMKVYDEYNVLEIELVEEVLKKHFA